MPYSKEFRAETEQKLGRVAPIESRAMFGGVAIYSDGLLFAIIDNDRIYFKASETTKNLFEDRGMGQFIYAEGAPPMSYWELPPGLIDTPSELTAWVERSKAVASEKKSKKRKA